MREDSRLDDLLLRWEELVGQGQDASPEQLCRDCPGHLPALRERIAELNRVAWLEAPDSSARPSPTPPAGRPLVPPSSILARRYRLDELLGEGSFGWVWRAFDLELQRLVAVKLAKRGSPAEPDRIDAFVSEARKVARLKHPGIVPVYDVGRHDGAYFIVLELIDGTNLRERQRTDPVPLRQAVRIVAEVARNLHYAHREGVIHRDIKPANLLLDLRGNVFVTDFGIAATEEELRVRQAVAGGTLAYMPPEQLAGRAVDVGPGADVYSLGVVLYELLTKRLPYEAKTLADIRTGLAGGNPAPPRSLDATIPPWIEQVCLKCLDHSPEKRYATAEALAEDLLRWPAEPPARRRSSKPLLLAAALLAVLGAGEGIRRWGVDSAQTQTQASPVAPKADEPRDEPPPVNLNEEPLNGKSQSQMKPQGKSIRFAPSHSITNSIGMELAYIPKGEFMMGSPTEDTEGFAAERPRHEVRITEAFYLGVHEVTQRQFKAVMGYNPSHFSRDGEGKAGALFAEYSKPAGGKDKLGPKEDPERYPVDNVSWEEAKEYCAKLSALAKEKALGHVYRLPTEAEWEYSSRAGAASYKKFSFGDRLTLDDANFNANLKHPCEVGSYKANAFGLHDMHGNVWEWCSDWYGEKFYAESPPENPVGPKEGSDRVVRGGSWGRDGGGCRSALRGGNTPSARLHGLGFRLALVPSR